MSDIEQKIREDLVAAGIDPDRYLQEANEFRRPFPEELTQFQLWSAGAKGAALNLYECPLCHCGRYHWNLRKSDEGWGCVECFGLQRLWRDFDEWQLELLEGDLNNV